jgi:hypothetical protein
MPSTGGEGGHGAPLPFSEACERNKGPILEHLLPLLTQPARVVEIGAGTGQHAVHFARALPHLAWLPTDRGECLSGLAARIARHGPPNLAKPLELDVMWPRWPVTAADVLYSANTLHIMSWPEVAAMIAGAGRLLGAGSAGWLILYGPFRYGGHYTSASNAAFDCLLRERDPLSGIRDIEAVGALAREAGLHLHADHRLPANNQLLFFRRSVHAGSAIM